MKKKCSTCKKLCCVSGKNNDYCYSGVDLKDPKAKCSEYEKGAPGYLV